jgi:integrase
MPNDRVSIGRGLTLDQARKLLHEASDDRLYALYVLALLLGLRRAELLGLLWKDVDLGKGALTISRSLQRVGGELKLVPPKTQHSVRTVPLPALAVEALEVHRARQGRGARGCEVVEHDRLRV